MDKLLTEYNINQGAYIVLKKKHLLNNTLRLLINILPRVLLPASLVRCRSSLAFTETRVKDVNILILLW